MSRSPLIEHPKWGTKILATGDFDANANTGAGTSRVKIVSTLTEATTSNLKPVACSLASTNRPDSRNECNARSKFMIDWPSS